jgi:hypothetical protein
MATENSGLPEPTTTPKMPKVSKPKGGTIKVETMSLEQFRSYLKGIMFVGGPTWRPDRDQWEAIVAIIDKLTVGTQATNYTQQAFAPAAAQGWDQTAPQWQPLPSALAAPPRQADDGDGPYSSPFV